MHVIQVPPTNNLELDAHFGGPIAISGLEGAGNLVFVYDATSNNWMVSSTGTGIAATLDSNLPDVNSMTTFTSNIITPTGPSPVSTQVSNGFSGWGNYGGFEGTFTVAAGDVGRLVYICGSYCTEGGVSIQDTATGTVYDMGRNNKRSGGGYQSPIGQQCTSSSGFSGTFYSDSYNGPCNTIGTIAPGTYNLYHWDYYGDGSNGGTINLETIAASAGFGGGSAGPYESNLFNGRNNGNTAYQSQSYVLDLANTNTPVMGTNAGFGGVALGGASGEFNLVCVTTAGHVIFMDGTDPACTPDATASSAGGQWQGFALGAGKTNFQYNGNGMLWQVRDIQPDPDSSAPSFVGGEIGDSHALDRTITVSIGDTSLYDSGLDVSPVPGVGPTIYYTITSADGSTSSNSLAMTPAGDRNLCAELDCSWSVDIDSLQRGDSVSYYMTAKDTYPLGANIHTTPTYSFDVGNPTNSLVIEWFEYSDDNSATTEDCSMQIVMYDETDEFEYHYDDNCYVYEDVGLIGVRESRTNFVQVLNNAPDNYIRNNPHSQNIRFTLTDSGDYAYEYFDLGIDYLPIASSVNAIPAGTAYHSTDTRCDSASDMALYGTYCAGNFDLPDDFNFDFYGQNYDGTDPLNRVHVSASGMIYFITDGSTGINQHQGTTGSSCWGTSGIMCDLDTTSSYFPDNMMAPFWSRENLDICYNTGGRDCNGVWYRVLPFDGQGTTESADITDDTTWYLVDSPIKVQPSDPSGYLSVMADLTIEPGVEVIVGENMGISFDGGIQADGTCAKFTAAGSGSDRITFNADRSINPNAQWHGLAFTDDCGGQGETGRHIFDMVDISNTNHAAITAGSRPADSSGPSCGTATQDCDIGEFVMNDVTYTNVESAFAHGSGQGTVVTMSNFAVTDSRSSCFNFAQNTVATLTGTALNPSTMTRCNTNNYDWAGAVASDLSGSTSGSLTMEYVDIVDSKVTVIRTDLQTVTISDVTATTPNIGDQWRWTGQSQWTYDNTGVGLGLSHGANSDVSVTNFAAPSYAQGWVCAANSINMNSVDLGVGFMTGVDHRFDVDPYCGAITSVPGTVGANSVFDDLNVPTMTMYRTLPGTANMITTAGDFKIAEFPSGTGADTVEITDANVGGVFVLDGCNADVSMTGATIGQLSSFCSAFLGSSALSMTDSSIGHTSSTDSAIYAEQTTGTFVNVDVTSSTVTSTGPFVLYAGYDSTVFLIDVEINNLPCADNSGKTSDCHTGKSTGTNADPEIYYGGFANALAYRLGQDTSTTPPTPTQIPESGVTITASTLDSTGAEILPGVTIYRTLTGADGRTSNVAVITGDDNGVVYDSHLIRASGAAGAGEVHPDLADGTPATQVEFIDGALQTNVPLADFSTYAMGSYADIRLVSPPVTLDDSGMDCAWMANDPYFSASYDSVTGIYQFKGATMVLADDLTIDGCHVELKGSKIIFREDVANNPTLTIANGGTLTMTIDTDTGDLPKIYGEGNLDAVDIAINSGGTLDMQGGTMKNFLLSSSKAGHIVVPSDAVFNMAGGAYLTATDLSTGPNDYPMVVADGGIVNVASSAVLAGSGNTGVGVELINAGELNGNGLTVSNMLTGINSDGGSINMDGYTSTANTNGVVAKDGPKLPEFFTSATLQGIATNYPTQNFGSYYGEIPGMDNCWYYHMYACWEWYEYTIDLTSWVGQTDYLQPSMMMNYGGTWNYYYSSVGGLGISLSYTPYITMDNLMIKVTDTNGNQYIVDDSTDAGYYPYGDNDPAVTGGTATYEGGLGGAPFWDCNYRARSYNPWRFGTNMYSNYYTYTASPSVGNLYGMSSNGYPEDFGFRVGQGDSPEPIGVSFYPYFSWGFDDPITGRQGLGPNGPTNPSTWHQTSTGETRASGDNYEACNARSPVSYASAGSNMMLEWPTLDLTDSSIDKVELQFDMMHRYFGSFTGFHANNNRDSVEILARGGDDPANMGDYSESILGKGVILSNSDITDATVGVDLLGGTYTELTNLDIDDPVSFGVRTSGVNSVYLDGLDVDDSSAGANTNYGFYTESTSSGIQEIKNSDFNGLGTGIYLTNDVSTTISDTDVSNSNVGVRVGAQSSAAHTFNNMILSNNDVAIKLDGTGSLTMTDVDVTSVTTDLEITDTSTVKFLDGTIDSNKVVIATSATGYLNRDRSYFAVLTADGNPVANANVVLSSRDASTSTTGSTDATGLTSGLSFSVYDYGSSGLTDYSSTFNTYDFSSIAKISYSWTDSATNDGDFRYIQSNPTMVDLPYDSATNTNYETLSLVNQVDIRVCGDDSNYVMVAPCAGTLSSSGSRVYSNGMIEYGDAEGLNEGTSTMDLSGKAIMIDTGTLELKDGVNYILDNAVVFDTGYTTQYGDGFAQWITDVPYGTTLTMNGGEVNGLYPITETGDVVGLVIGGLQGSNEGALNLDIDGVSFNNIAGIATGTGDRTSSSFSGSFNTYIPSVVSIENSFINHYRGYFFYPTAYSDGDYCLRLQGTTAATISGNTFSDCTIGISFLASDWQSSGTTSVTHEQIGSDNVVIDGNTFTGASGYNIMAWPDSDADLTVISNNVMSCNTCLHVRYMDDTSVKPTISGNTFNGGSFGVYTDDTEYVDIENNVFNNQDNMAIRASGGDIDPIGNTINDAGEYAIYADSLEKPGEIIETVVAGVSSPQPDDGVSFISWNGDTCPLPTYIQACTSPDVSTVLAAGDELVIRMHEGGSYAYELSINWKDPNNLIGNWDPANVDGSTSHESGSPSPLIFDIPGLYSFNLEDSYGDGANGGGFEIISAPAGSWASVGANTNPKQFWDPGVAGLLSVEPGYRGPYVGYAYSPSSGLPVGYSNTLDGVLLQNNGADVISYEFTGVDQWGDGWNGNFMRMQVAPIGSWTTSTTGYPPISGNTGGPQGTTIGGIGGSSTTAYPWTAFTSGRYSAPIEVTLDPGYEMRFSMHRGGSWAGEVVLQIQETQAPDNSWTGPKIWNNDINFDSANNNPNAVGLYLSNCDVQDYTIATQSNTIDIGQNAVFNDGCAWSDQSSTFTGSNVASSIGYNDDNTFNVDLSLDGTTISGFETGLYKAGGGTLTITNAATITAGAGGMGVHTDGIDVSVIGATFDGGATGTGIMIENSNYAWLYPMDVSGFIGLHAVNSEILWDGGSTDASTAIRTENVQGTIQSITDNSVSTSGGAGLAAAISTTTHSSSWFDLYPAGASVVSNGNTNPAWVGTGAADTSGAEYLNLVTTIYGWAQKTSGPMVKLVDNDANSATFGDESTGYLYNNGFQVAFLEQSGTSTGDFGTIANSDDVQVYFPSTATAASSYTFTKDGANVGFPLNAQPSTGGIQVDAQTDSRITVIDFPLDETRMLVDSTSIVDEANWLNLDVDHLGADPTSQVGVSVMADLDYTAYNSPIFGTTILVDGAGEDWVGGNALNPSGYAMPGSIGGPMYLAVDGTSLVFGFDSVSTATSDVYIYVDSNDNAGSTTGYNDVHTLPYPADFAIVVNAQGSSVYYYNAPSWVLDPSAAVISAEGAFLELSVPVSALGGSSVDTMNIVSTVQMTGTNDVSAVSPTQTVVGTGAETLDGSYELVLNKLDLSDGTLSNEVLIHRSFEFTNVPTTPYTYDVMVKTAAEARHTCDFDWAEESAVTMDVTKTLTFDILRACPEITSDLRDITVDEDTGAVSLDLASYVDDEQDVEANMEWDVTGSNMDAFAGILSDFDDLTAATGTYSITPINDQFGTFDMEFVVVDSNGQTASKTIVYTVLNINDAPVICDARTDVDPDCENGNVYLYSDVAGQRYNSRDEGFTSYSKPLGKDANDTINSFIRDMANEQFPVSQDYTWGATSDCDQISVSLQPNANGVDEIVIVENQAWEEGGTCDITLTLEDDGAENQQADSVVVPFSVTPVNDEPVIAVAGQVTSADASNSFTGELNGNYRVTLVEDTTDSDALTFDLSGIKSDIDHVDADLSWVLEDTNTCTSSNYYSHSIVGDTLSFDLITDATTNAEPWEVDMLNNNGIHQTRTANGYCEMTLTLSDLATEPSYMPNYTALSPNNYMQESVSVTLSIKVDNVVENVPDYFLDDAEGFDFNGVNNIMPGTWVPVDFSINAAGDEGPYTYNHLLKVSLQTDGHDEVQLPVYYTPPAYGTSLDIDDWEVYMTDQTTEVWVEVDVVTCNPGQVCTPASNSIQSDSPESHNAVSGSQVFGKWSEPGRIGESADGTQSNRRPAFEDKNWCNNLMTSNAAGTTVAWSESSQCGHTEQGYGGAVLEDWQTGDNNLPVTVTTIGALSVASFAPSIIAVALTGMFVSALVFAGRRDDDEEDFMEETMSDDESAVSPVIATILMVAITVVLSGVVYVWAAQLADTDTKGVPVVTFSADNIDTASTDTDHWKITIGQAQTVLATQAIEVTVSYINGLGEPESQTINLASTNQVYGFSPYNSDSLVTFGDVVTIDGDETISTFSTGDDIYVKTHLADGTPLVDATIRVVYNPPGDTQGATLKTYSGMNWNQPV